MPDELTIRMGVESAGFVRGVQRAGQNRFHRLHPIAQRQALQTAEKILHDALATVRQVKT